MDHNDIDAPDDAEDWVLELEHIPGVESPTKAVLATLEAAPENTAEQTVVENGRLVWNYHVCCVLGDHPQIGVAGSAANERFVDLFRALGSRFEDLRTVAEFVMIYPPKEQSGS